MRLLPNTFALGLAAAFALGAGVGAVTLLPRSAGEQQLASARETPPAAPDARAVWTEVEWPFPRDQWGKGKAFQCEGADCGSGVRLYVRAKLGFCDCTNGIADDDDVDRMSDFDFVGGDVAPLGEGRPIAVGTMKGRSRAYALKARNAPGKTALSVVFNDRCDMVAATAVLPHERTAAAEPAVLEFLNSTTVLRWAEVALGL